MTKHPLIFTDLDGTLLDHFTYSFEPVVPVLAELANRAIPVIPTTSKTFDEVVTIRAEIGLDGPFIIENGAAVFMPKTLFSTRPQGTESLEHYWCKSLTQPVAHWHKLLETVPDQFRGMYLLLSNMSVSDVQRHTGLDITSAKRAQMRRYSEPVKWIGDNQYKQQFIDYLRQQGAHIVEGGRFLHVSGHCDKSLAMTYLSERYQSVIKHPITTIALGDGNNDVGMLTSAEIAIVIRSPVHPPPVIQHANPIISIAEGPAGWAQTISNLLF